MLQTHHSDLFLAEQCPPEENANDGFGGWQWQTVRTSTSENAAVRACYNAR